MSGKIRSGWELVRADEYPDFDYPSMKDGKYAGVIGVGGLVLARIPEEIAKSREAFFAQQTKDRDDAVNNDLMKEQHSSCLLYTSPSPRDRQKSRMPSSA